MNTHKTTQTLITLLFWASIQTGAVASTEHQSHDHTAEHGYEIEILLNMNETPTLHQTIPVGIKVMSHHLNFLDLNVELTMTEGLHAVKPMSSKKVPTLSPTAEHETEFWFKAYTAGRHKISIKVSGLTDQGVYKDRYAYLKFTVASDPGKNTLGWAGSVQVIDEDQRSHPSNRALTADANGMITVHEADEHLNEVVYQQNANEFINSRVQGGGTVAISGRYRFRNRENTSYVGFYRNLMRLINANTGAHLDWTYSDDDGNFTFDPVTNPGGDGMRVRAYSVRYLSGNGYGVCEYPTCEDNAAADSSTYDDFYYRQTAPFTTSDGNQDIGTYTSEHSLSNSLRALWIKNDMDEAYIHVNFHTNITGPMTAEWADDNDDHGNHYHRDGNIHFKSDVGDGTNHTVMHEVGHNVMWNAGTFPEGSDCPSPHFINQISGIQCAWTEGWASIFLTLVNNNPSKCSPPSTTNCVDFEIHPSFTYCQDWYCGPDSDQVEGHVVGAVWDLFDNNDDDFDVENFNISTIYQILENDTNDSFVSWWTSWLNAGNSSRALNSLFQNDIIYGDPYDIRVNNPSVNNSSPAVNQNISATVALRNLGNVSSVATNINFYLSTNSTISPFDQSMGIDFRGILDPNLAVFSSHQFSVATAGTYWVGACFDDPYGFDTVTSNDCSSGVEITVTDDLIFADGFE